LIFQVTEHDAGERLDRFVTSNSSDISRARVKQLIEQGFVLVDKEKSRPGRRLKQGQIVALDLPEPEEGRLEPDHAVDFGIIFQDPDIIVVNKPAGLVVHPAAGHASGTLVHGLLAVVDDLAGVGGEIRPGIVHRLDKDTSGVMVVAKHDLAHRKLVAAFKERMVDKEYLAICLGIPGKKTGEIDSPIGRHPVRRKEMSIRSVSGRPALTRYSVLESYGAGLSLIRVHILTGRTHQIRVHMASIGHPVFGDHVYGRGLGGLKKTGPPLSRLVGRHLLHARRIELLHPMTGERLAFEAPLPEDMAEVLAVLNPAPDTGFT
jgi:23S rRNA pseudouridine1911/1915/1917 synthase